MATKHFPPFDYSVNLANIVDFHIKYNPAETIYTFADEGNSGYTNVSFLEFGHAVHRAAHHIRPGRNGPDGEVIAFVALTDSLLYQAVMMGIIKAGNIPYFMSPRNTAAAIVKMMKDTSCHRLLTTQQTLRTLVEDVQKLHYESDPNHSLRIDEVPALFSIFPQLGHSEISQGSFHEYPSGVQPSMNNVALYLHSSGSTGLPKTVPQTFKTMVNWGRISYISEMKKSLVPLKVSVHALPPFHTMAVLCQIHGPMYSLVPVGLFPPTAIAPNLVPVIPTPHNILEHIKKTNCNALMGIPTLLQVWGQDAGDISFLASLEFVGAAGGPIPTKLGNLMLESGVRIRSGYGGTEFGTVGIFNRSIEDRRDWEYISFPVDSKNIRWEPQGDGTYELHVLTTDTYQVSVENLPDVQGYATSDLFIPHPTKPHLWKIVGRKGDVITHASGEKTVPAPMEDILMSSPYIIGAILFGRARDQAGVLIELKSPHQIDVHSEKELIAIRNKLWPIVEEANKIAPAFSRIFKEMILIAASDKPLPRAGKGTVMRKAALELYTDEIDEIYSKVDATANVEAVVPPTTWDIKEVADWLSAQISELLLDKSVSSTGDLFEQGMDSLSSTILRRRIVAALQSTGFSKANQAISHATIYEHPSVKRLSAFISGLIKDPEALVMNLSSEVDAIDSMISKFSTGLDTPLAPPKKITGEKIFLLTGSTGNLGSQLLESLLRDPKVSMVYALNRPTSSTKSIAQRHLERFSDKGLDSTLLNSDRLVYLEGESSHLRLGLSEDAYDKLRCSVTTIIHNAWRLDFNLSLSSFEPNIQGTRNLIDLARASKYFPKFLFTSSVASASSWDKRQGPYPEEILKESKYAAGNGYGESKYVAERILQASGLEATSFRIGQISGDHATGAWATTDWVPILVKSSIHMNALPNMQGVISWIPMDSVSDVILEVAHSAHSPPALNIVHPRPVSWASIMSSINGALVREGAVTATLPMVDMQIWIAGLKKHADNASAETTRNIPAIKLISFFISLLQRESASSSKEVGGITTFSTAKAQSISVTLQVLPEIKPADAERWVKYWKSSGFI